MKKTNTETPLVDEYLQSIVGMKAAETDPFFYTRLKAKMQNKLVENEPPTNLKWVFAICTLAVFLTINCLMLAHPQKLQNNQVYNTAQQDFTNTFSIETPLSY